MGLLSLYLKQNKRYRSIREARNALRFRAPGTRGAPWIHDWTKPSSAPKNSVSFFAVVQRFLKDKNIASTTPEFSSHIQTVHHQPPQHATISAIIIHELRTLQTRPDRVNAVAPEGRAPLHKGVLDSRTRPALVRMLTHALIADEIHSAVTFPPD